MQTPSPEAVALALRLGTALGSAVRPRVSDQQLTDAVVSVRALFGAAACSVALLEPDEESLRFVAADGAGAEAIRDTVMSADRGIAGWVAMSGQALIVGDVRADPRFAKDVAESTSYVPESIMAAPLLTGEGEVLGVIEVLDRDADDAGSGRDLDVLGLLAVQLAAVVALAARFDRLGASVVAGITGSGDDAQVVARMLGAADGDEELAAVLSAAARLVARGPGGRRLVQQVLDAVDRYSGEGR